MSKTPAPKNITIILPLSTWDEICAYLQWAQQESEAWATEEGADDDMDYIQEHRNRAHGIEIVRNQLTLFMDHTPDTPIVYVTHFEMSADRWKAVKWVQAHDLWHFEQFALLSLRLTNPTLLDHIEEHSEEYYIVTAEVNDGYRTTLFHREKSTCTPMTTNQPEPQTFSNGFSVETI